MAEIYANNVRGKLAEPVLAADTRLTLQPGHNFIDPGSHWYRATLFRWEFTSEGIREFDHEVVKVTALAGDSLTVERELEGTAHAYDPDTPIELRMTAGTASDIEARLTRTRNISSSLWGTYVTPLTMSQGLRSNPPQRLGIQAPRPLGGLLTCAVAQRRRG